MGAFIAGLATLGSLKSITAFLVAAGSLLLGLVAGWHSAVRFGVLKQQATDTSAALEQAKKVQAQSAAMAQAEASGPHSKETLLADLDKGGA
ncbi:hypothetical protein E3E12_08035 [Formicincola oecophyllae]|uniref:Uncharacterized protein n=1 Tax=Formicincola oecophyllae TaxID=2558361 RepID=A0A4Y6UDP6_9PROT|nr:hypothetical protein [Formicincola oecophyllae]QDH14145.1 hypothetical protein E3E12_08035 [Formicincola oecophyllae]